MYVHRLAWFLDNGEWPGDFYVCHTCDVPLCVHPKHLVLGTALDNSRHMVQRKRSLYGHKNPSCKYDENMVRRIRDLRSTGLPFYKISKETGVSKSQIMRICKNKSWKYIG